MIRRRIKLGAVCSSDGTRSSYMESREVRKAELQRNHSSFSFTAFTPKEPETEEPMSPNTLVKIRYAGKILTLEYCRVKNTGYQWWR